MKYLFTLILFNMLIQDNFLTYNNSKENYSVSYENIWEKKITNSNTIFFLKENKSEFKTNINLLTQDLSKQPLSLNEYHQITLGQIENNIGISSIISKKDTKVSNFNAKELIYVVPASVQNRYELKIKQVYFIEKNKAFLITYVSSVNDFNLYLKSANIFFKEFKITDNLED